MATPYFIIGESEYKIFEDKILRDFKY